MSVQEPAAIFEHCRMLLRLSFETEWVFTPLLTHLLEQLCLTQEAADLQGVIEQRLDESPNRQAHVRLLLALYFQSGRTEDYLRLARSEGEGYRLINALFTCRQADEAWKALEAFPLSVDEYWCLLQSPIVQRVPQFTQKLLNLLGSHHTDLAIQLYRKLIDWTVLSRKREDYEKVQGYLTQLRICYQQLDQDNQWSVYLKHFQKRHARKGLLLKILAEGNFTS